MTRFRFDAATRHCAPDALELLGPTGWYFRLDPAGVENVWPCGPRWSCVRMSRATKGALLVRGNAVEIIRRCDMLRRNRRECVPPGSSKPP
jgi:hypothetical protein